MSITGIIALPCILMALVFGLTITTAYRSHSPTRPFLLYPLVCTFFVTSGYMIWGYYAICTSRSSTAAIGFLFLPFFSVAFAVIGFVVSWACLYVVHFVIQRIEGTPVRLVSVALFVLAVALLAWTGYVGQNKIARHRLLDEAASGFSVDRLETILADGVSFRDWEVLSNLAKNPNTPINDLVRLFDYCKPSIAEFNPPEYPILFSLAQNPQTPSDILVVLAGCRQSSIRFAVATNPSTPTQTLRRLAEDQNVSVKTYAIPRLNARERSVKRAKGDKSNLFDEELDLSPNPPLK
jgi:hypothetical protein